MSRLDTIRAYFADQFFSTLVNDPRLATLQYPAELFSGPGNFIIPSTVAGLTQIPTIANLEQRITTATGAERADLQTFAAIELEALAAIVPGLATQTSSWGDQIAATYAPIVYHPDDQAFFPASMHDFLNYTDGTLAARYYAASGQQALPGQIFQLLFNNPEVINATGLPTAPYETRLPFAATIGSAPPETGYPTDPLDSGRLDLGPAVGRLGPGRLPPTLYAEIKGVDGALQLNQAYQAAALTGGQYAALRNNRIHTDPLPPSPTSGTSITADNAAAANQAIMIVYHGFYPADDEARRRPGIGATNREFHHLGYGILIPPPTIDSRTTDAEEAQPPAHERPTRHPGRATGARLHPQDAVPRQGRTGYLFVCVGPDAVRMFPLDHPVLQMVNDQGAADPAGTHANIYFANTSPGSWQATFDLMVTHGQSAGATVGEYLGAIGAGAIVGAIAGTDVFPGVGTVVGAVAGAIVVAAAELLFILYALFCSLTGTCGGQGAQVGQGPGDDTGDNSYTQSSNVLSPPGVQPQVLSPPAGQPVPTGPTRSFGLNLIPHFPDRNLYGINAGGNATFTISNDASTDELLAWLGFPGGLGYQFEHTIPGPTDVAGSSLRNYFDLFVKKYLDVEAARGQVTYFA